MSESLDPRFGTDASSEDDSNVQSESFLLPAPQHKNNRERRRSKTIASSKLGLSLIGSITVFLGITTWLVAKSPSWRKSSEVISPCTGNWEDCQITAPFIFDSLHALAKQWPSSYAPNGHSVVTTVIPRGVPLYHAKGFIGDVKKPTWVSFDPEMGLGIYAAWSTVAIDHTFVTTKPLSLLYFDGSAAVLTKMGTLDSQTAFLREQVTLDPGNQYTYDEDQRALDVCERIKGLGIDGMMRMDAGFEAMICDRTESGLKQLAATNVTVPGQGANRDDDVTLPQDPHRRPPNGYGSIFAPQSSWEWVRSGTWHYGGFGGSAYNQRETRAMLNQCGFVTFYDPRLSSLRGKHRGGLRDGESFEMGWGLRRGHRLLDVSREDAQMFFKWTKEAVDAAKHSSIESGSKMLRD